MAGSPARNPVVSKIRQSLPTGRVGHFQIAGVPERHEPSVGELKSPYLFQVIGEVAQQCGWQGWVGSEYRPALGATDGAKSTGLAWLRALAATSALFYVPNGSPAPVNIA